MYQTPPPEVQENLRLLAEDLDAKIPTKQLDRNLLIASWNIRAFGDLTRKWASEEKDNPKRDMHAVLCIAEIIRRFDVIAVQEVKSNIRALRDTLKILGPEWSMILTDVTKGDAGNGERMAYLFDTRRVNLSGLAGELVVPKEWSKGISDNVMTEQFVRTPYAVSFRSKSQTFILVTLHVIYGKKAEDRIPELKGIAQWLSGWAKDINAYHHNLIVLGDFNIEERGDLLHKTFVSEGLYVPDALQNEAVTRSIFNQTKFYDQIAWFNGDRGQPKLSLEFNTGGNYDFTTTAMINRGLSRQRLSFMISDHYPLWAEFKL
ncbi:endonuclease/exonuclease/phosphatase family protein [Porphyromonas sp.]|uniref:endonuclease/exonuclease/phosphatase family protein n=1 Tax=Porphyromonas sp. TaxID=1924944 RepID=UPI0026DBB391|nr:endonuclease/exonuclease/phosphatase family protein [Porphyromonas sp.]MDO4771159.1 endonuclease/exonuclease/phosphatase family protein [Porphyromonas sp.]